MNRVPGTYFDPEWLRKMYAELCALLSDTTEPAQPTPPSDPA
jgi:hypothetical protein